MRLLITDEVRNEVSFDTVIMTSIEFNNIHSHPFIASSKFDQVIIDLNDRINVEYLLPLIKTTVVVPRVVGEVSPHAVSILCEIYKDEAAKIRITYIRDKEAFKQLIDDMCKKYKWEEFYRE